MADVTKLSSNQGLKLRDYLEASSPSKELTKVIEAAADGIRLIAKAMRSSTHLLGVTTQENVQGETQAQLDVYADEVMTAAFFGSGQVAALVSEEQKELLKGGASQAPFIVAHDPLDGSSNIPFNIPVGTIFSVFKRLPGGNEITDKDYFQSGRSLCAAGYGVYGMRTQFVFSMGQGVIEATLHEASGEFVIVNQALKCAPRGIIFSVNEGNSASWPAKVRNFIESLKSEGAFSGRYVGSLVSDFDRNLRKGGIYLYPEDKKNLRGKLRLLYECLPLAFICEQAGGESYDGHQSVLDVVPTGIHERCPLYLGSPDLVKKLRG